MQAALLLALIATLGCKDVPDVPVAEGDSPGETNANDVPLCDVSALPGALDDQRCMARLSASNLRYKHGVLGSRLETMKGAAVAGLRARHTAWTLTFEASDETRALAALELYEIALEMAIIERGGPRWDTAPDSKSQPVATDAGNAEADDNLGVAPVASKTAKSDKPTKSDTTKISVKSLPKSQQGYAKLYKRIGASLKKAKLGKADRLVMAYKSLDFKAGLKDVKVRHSYIATLKTIERQLAARK